MYFQYKQGTLFPLLLLKNRPFTLAHFHLGTERRNTNPVYLGKEDSREVITGSVPVQTPYFSTVLAFVSDCLDFL